jgi:hypothetical protein
MADQGRLAEHISKARLYYPMPCLVDRCLDPTVFATPEAGGLLQNNTHAADFRYSDMPHCRVHVERASKDTCNYDSSSKDDTQAVGEGGREQDPGEPEFQEVPVRTSVGRKAEEASGGQWGGGFGRACGRRHGREWGRADVVESHMGEKREHRGVRKQFSKSRPREMS